MKRFLAIASLLIAGACGTAPTASPEAASTSASTAAASQSNAASTSVATPAAASSTPTVTTPTSGTTTTTTGTGQSVSLNLGDPNVLGTLGAANPVLGGILSGLGGVLDPNQLSGILTQLLPTIEQVLASGGAGIISIAPPTLFNVAHDCLTLEYKGSSASSCKND